MSNPVDQQITESAEAHDEDLIIALSQQLPSVKVSDPQSAHAFLEDDGGYSDC